MLPSIPLFFALKPDPMFGNIVQSYKDRIFELVGPQLYLSDPPHLTLFLAQFSTEYRSLQTLRLHLCDQSPIVRLNGWHSWVGDPLTGCNTLVCDIHDDDKIALRKFQNTIVKALAPHRDRVATLGRYSARWSALNHEQQSNILEFGFPYLGDGWQPHVSIASIEPRHWEQVMAEFQDVPPHGTFTFSALDEYELHGVEPCHRYSLTFHS